MTEANGHEPGTIDFFEALNRSGPKPPRPRSEVVPLSPDTLVNPEGYTRAAFERETARVRNAPDRTRNKALNTAAFSLGQHLEKGLTTEEAIYLALREAAFDAGLDEGEVDPTIASGIRGGMTKPRDITPLSTSTVTEVSAEEILRSVPAAVEGVASLDEMDRGPSSWSPQPLRQSAALALGAPDPTHLVRTDGKALLYSGKINALIGESESGKSWIALLAAVQALRNGEQVLLLDFEDNPLSVLNRVNALGITEMDDLDRIDYARPDEALGVLQRDDLIQALRNHYAVIVVDGVNAAMVLLGLDLNSNTDATLFTSRLLKPLAATGACVITVDHVPKNPEARGKGGIGAQAKRAMIDGASLLVEVLEPFGKGQPGTLKLSVDKDRNGMVRGISAGGKNPGTVRINSILDRVDMVIEAPMAATQEEVGQRHSRPTGFMTKISALLEEVGPLSQNQILQAILGNSEQRRKAIDRLVTEGFVARSSGAKNAIIYTSVRPFIEHPDAEFDQLDQARPEFDQKGAQRVRPPTPIPLGGGRTQRGPEPSENPSSSTNPYDVSEKGLRCRRCDTEIPEETWDANDGYCRDCAWAGGR